MDGFMKFMREQNIVSMAVALAVGIAAANAVSTLVSGFVNPIVGFILGGSSLSQETWTVVEATLEDPGLVISWGAIASALINLVAVAFVVYWLAVGLKFTKKK